MSRIYKHSHNPSDMTMDNINRIVDIIETYLCDYKLEDMIKENERRGYEYLQ